MTYLEPSQRNIHLNLAHFPAEIVRLILEHLGRSSGSEAARLICISRLVHAWILPVLYETVVLKDERDLHQVKHNLTKYRELAPYVHNLCLELRGANAALGQYIESLLSQCQCIRSLYLSSTTLPLHYKSTLLPHLVDLHCGSWGAWMTNDVLAFQPITHLRADLVHNQGVSSSWAPLLTPSHVLPNLTHLAFCADGRATWTGRRVTAQFLRDVLAVRPHLIMIVFTVWFCWNPGDMPMYQDIADPRLCILMTNDWPDDAASLSDWEDAVRGRQSIWDKARIVMERHRVTGAAGVAVGSIEWVSQALATCAQLMSKCTKALKQYIHKYKASHITLTV